MNNLLQSLASQRLRLRVPEADLRRLLTSVKESRGHDSKLSDAFYESLESIVMDLRTVTIDNRDAEAFLKPVSRVDYPDYFEIISNPMDLQTVLKRVKQKHYKSKKEFADDLDLIWSNCYVYNTGDNHPLRLCVNRLREKANKLLKNVTDRKDRVDPPLPPELSANGTSVKMNGRMVNGHSRTHSASPMPLSRAGSVMSQSSRQPAKISPVAVAREVPFPDMPAIIRSSHGMAKFLDLDSHLETEGAGPSSGPYVGSLQSPAASEEDWPMGDTINGILGEKRKIVNGDVRPRKRSKNSVDDTTLDSSPLDQWWESTLSSDLLANGYPSLKFSNSFALEGDHRIPEGSAPIAKNVKRKKKRRPPESDTSRSLLGHINNNIRTLKRIRRTHDKFLALNLNSEEGAAGTGSVEPPEAPPIATEDEVDVQVDERPWRSRGSGVVSSANDADDCLHWMGTKILEHSGFQSTSKAALDVFTGVATEYLLNVGRTIRFLSDKYSHSMSAEEIILHTLFESGITQVHDLERYITDDVMRYGSRLSDLEKKLVGAYQEITTEEALDDDAFFAEDEEEEGELLMGNFADSFGDDFLGLRELGIASELGLSNLTVPKKLLRRKDKGALSAQDAKPKEPPLPYPLPPNFLPLESTRVESQIGILRDFYIRRFNDTAASSNPPKPVPFIPAPSPIIAPPPPVPPRPLSPTSLLQGSLEMELMGMPHPPAFNPSSIPYPSSQHLRIPNPTASPLQLPDDIPNVARTKIGPLGQILRPSASSGAKKKAKPPKDTSHMGGAPGMMPGAVATPALVPYRGASAAAVTLTNGTGVGAAMTLGPGVISAAMPHGGGMVPIPGPASGGGDPKKKTSGSNGAANGNSTNGSANGNGNANGMPSFIAASA